MSSLKTGLNAYLDGAKQLNDGIKTLYDGTGTLVEGATTINASAKTISDAIAALDATLNTAMTDEEKAAIAGGKLKVNIGAAADDKCLTDNIAAHGARLYRLK